MFWRGCGQVGDYVHMFWDCPKITEYWKNIKTQIEGILNENIDLDLQIFLLGIIPKNVPARKRKIIRMLIIIAKKMITMSWLEPQPPSVKKWWDRVEDVMGMEEVTARLQNRLQEFKDMWSPLSKGTIGL